MPFPLGGPRGIGDPVTREKMGMRLASWLKMDLGALTARDIEQEGYLEESIQARIRGQNQQRRDRILAESDRLNPFSARSVDRRAEEFVQREERVDPYI